MKTIERVITTDGGALDLATAILTIAYGLPRVPGAADKLRTQLGLGDAVVHTTETAFSYPNAVALVRDERGRKAVYVFDSDQETLTEGKPLKEADPDAIEPTADAPVALGSRAPDDVKASITGSPAVGLPDNAPPIPPAGDGPNVEGVSDKTDAETAAAGIERQPEDGKLDPAAETLTPIAPTPAPEPFAEPSPYITGAHAETLAPTPGLTPGHPADAVTGDPVELTSAEHERLSHVAIDGDTDAPMALGQGFTGIEASNDGVMREHVFEAAPGIGASSEQIGGSDAPAVPPRPQDEGWAAYKAGKTRSDNPYEVGDARRGLWMVGFEVAMDEAPASTGDTTPAVDATTAVNEGQQLDGSTEKTLKTNAYMIGVTDYEHGVRREVAPYVTGTQEHIDWLAGYDFAAAGAAETSPVEDGKV